MYKFIESITSAQKLGKNDTYFDRNVYVLRCACVYVQLFTVQVRDIQTPKDSYG